MKILLYSVTAFVVLSIGFACSKSTNIGSDLFVPDRIDLFFQDDFEIVASTETVDFVLTFDGNVALSSLTVGVLQDPIFGTTRAEGFVNVRLAPSGEPPVFTFTDVGVEREVTLDSAVLVLQYDDLGFYGDTSARHELEVYILDEELSSDSSLYSDFRPGSSTLIGSKSFVPSRVDTLLIFEPGDTSARKVANQLRMRLDDSWVQAMIDDPALIEDADAFSNYTPGIHLVSNPQNGSTMSFDFGAAESGAAPNNNIYVYYTDNVSQKVYTFGVRGVRHNYYEHDYSTGEIAPFIGNEAMGDSLLFIQGLSGTHVDVELPVLSSDELSDFLINQVELEMFVYEDPNFRFYPAAQNILVQAYQDDGSVILIQDAVVAFETSQPAIFDGMLDTETINGMEVKKYRALLSLYAIQKLQEMDGVAKLRISVRNKSLIPNRSIIYGPGHSTYPMKLKANYSK